MRQPRPPPPEPDNQQQLVYVCIGNLGGDEVAVVVYDFTCQIVYRIVDSLLREWG